MQDFSVDDAPAMRHRGYLRHLNAAPTIVGYGFFSTILPFSHATIVVLYNRAIFRARNAAADIARFTES